MDPPAANLACISGRAVYYWVDGPINWEDLMGDDKPSRAELEAQVADLTRKLEESERRVSDLFDTMGDSLFIIDPMTMQILEVNKNAARRLGYEADEMVGMSLDDLEQKMPGPTGELSAWESTFSRTSFYECLHRRKDGSFVPVEISSRLVKRDGKGVLLNIVRDITVRKQLEDEREALISELNAYAHSVAHDLKNPVAIVMGYSDILRMDHADLPGDEMHKYLEIIHNTAIKMQTIIDALLLLASVRRQDQVPMDKLDMGAIVAEATARLQNVIKESGATINRPDDWPDAFGHAPWVEEVWMNYLSNALKYGGEPPEIDLGAERQDDGLVCCWVRDNGQGIAAEDKPKLFGQFTRLDVARAEGHGLGLSIVQRIVEQLGGTVGVESEVGKGSTFYFTLPGE